MKTVSAVIVSRNDNYGGNLYARALACLNAMVQAFDEVVYVDWNSPGRSLIEEVRLELTKTGKLKHICISPDQAKTLVPDPQAQDCCEVMGRNIGIRRAKSDFIASTNIDIIPSPVGTLDKLEDKFYVAPRRDIDNWQPLVSRGSFMSDRHPWKSYLGLVNELQTMNLSRKPRADDGHSVVVCCGDFQMAPKKVWHQIRGFEETMVYRAFADTNVCIKAKQAGFEPTFFDYDLFHLNHYDAGYQRMHQVKPLNDKQRYVENFKQTSNSELWGCSTIDFPVEVI
jgi:hypothetical protein